MTPNLPFVSQVARLSSSALPIGFARQGAVSLDLRWIRLRRRRPWLAAGVAAAIAPVPGGVGPVTTSLLLRNVAAAARQSA